MKFQEFSEFISGDLILKSGSTAHMVVTGRLCVKVRLSYEKLIRI